MSQMFLPPHWNRPFSIFWEWKMPLQLLIPKTELTSAEGSVVLAARQNFSANILPLSTIPFIIAANAYCCVIHVALL
jgi:hypothetical protein